MDTIFSDYELTASRLAELLVTSTRQHEGVLTGWNEDDNRTVRRRNFYRRARTAIASLHKRDASPQDLRFDAGEWRLEAEANPESEVELLQNARAVEQYLDEHGERQLLVLDGQRLETCVGRLRVTAAPHLFVDEGGRPLRVWLDCSETRRHELLEAKCWVTIWIAARMKAANAGVEVVHAATKHIVAPERLPEHFDATVTLLCESVHKTWRHLTAMPSREGAR